MKQQDVTARIILEVLGAPKDHVEKSLIEAIDKLKKEERVQLLSSKRYETEQLEESKFWSTFAEVEFKAKDMKDVLDVCFDYMPSALEILEPAGLEMDTEYLAQLFNDLLARIHHSVAVVKNYEAENRLLKMELEKKNE